MRIGLSGIAWDPHEDDAVVALLHDAGVSSIDIAPGKYFADPASTTRADAERFGRLWRDAGIEIYGMQSLLFGTQGLNLFGDEPVRSRMLDRLDGVCRLGGWLGAKRLVFGSPRNRDASGLAADRAEAIAVEFFRSLGDRAASHDVVVCLEPNPRAYGANFMVDSQTTSDVVRRCAHPNIGMQLDIGALAMNGETIDAVLEAYGPLIEYVHISDPGLKPLHDEAHHRAVGMAVSRAFPRESIATIETLRDDVDPLGAIARSIALAQRCYAT